MRLVINDKLEKVDNHDYFNNNIIKFKTYKDALKPLKAVLFMIMKVYNFAQQRSSYMPFKSILLSN